MGKIWLVGIFILLSCNKQGLIPGNPDEGDSSNNDRIAEERDFSRPDQDAQQDSDAIVIPTAVSGSYLACFAQIDPNSDQAPANQDVYCALRNKENDNLLSLDTDDFQVEWGIAEIGQTRNKLNIAGLANHAQYHVRYEFQGLNPDEYALVRDQARFTVVFKKGDVSLARVETEIKPMLYFWQPLNGGRLPETAVAGGTEHKGNRILYLCRIHSNAGIIPGKLMVHFNDPNKTMCYAIAGNAAIQSYSDDANTLILNSDIMIVADEDDLSKLSWVAASNGDIPPNALAGGYDSEKNPIYICRNLEAGPPTDPAEPLNDPNGEPTPGRIASGETQCRHEYFGIRSNSNYEVLVLLP